MPVKSGSKLGVSLDLAGGNTVKESMQITYLFGYVQYFINAHKTSLLSLQVKATLQGGRGGRAVIGDCFLKYNIYLQVNQLRLP